LTILHSQSNSVNNIVYQKQNQNSIRPDENFSKQTALKIRSEIKGVDDREKIKSNIQKMDRSPHFLGNIFPGVGSCDKDDYQIKTNRPKRNKKRLIV